MLTYHWVGSNSWRPSEWEMSTTALLRSCRFMPMTFFYEVNPPHILESFHLTILHLEKLRFRMINLPNTAQLMSDANLGLSLSNAYFLITLLNNSRKHCLQLKIIFSTSFLFKWQIFALVIRTCDFVECTSNVQAFLIVI